MMPPTRTVATAPPALILIGMAASGKTTIGRALATVLARPFLDTDTVLATRTGRSLPSLLATLGPQGFCQAEAEAVCHLVAGPQVIATGGSVVYSPTAIHYLRRLGYLIWLDAPTPLLLARLAASGPRGLVRRPSDPLDLKQLIGKRRTLYAQAADWRYPITDAPPIDLARTLCQTLPSAWTRSR